MLRNKINNSSKIDKFAIILFAIFMGALFTGFMSSNSGANGKTHANRRNMMQEMAKILKTLKPLLQNETATVVTPVKHADLSEDLAELASFGIVKSFPDGSWQLDQTVTRGESVYYFDQLLSLLSSQMKHRPLILETSAGFSDINTEHWLYKPMSRLTAIGAMAFAPENLFNSNKPLSCDELKSISSAFISYLASNLLLIVHDGREISITSKGALSEISMINWSYSLNGTDWQPLPENRRIIPNFDHKKVCRLFFRHADYYQAGPIQLFLDAPAIGSIKLQRHYSINARSLASSTAVTASTNERDRLRRRLEELKNRKNSPEKTIKAPAKEHIALLTTGIKPQEVPAPIIPDLTLPITQEPAARATATIALFNSQIAAEPQIDEQQDPEFAAFGEENVTTETADETDSGVKKYTVRVTNSLTGAGLAEAMVMIDGSQFTADATGKVTFQANIDSMIDITAYSEGYEALQLKHRTGYRQGDIKLALKPVITNFSGKVICTVSGSPVPRALIKMGEKATISGKDGSFIINGAQEGYQQLSCFSDKYMEAHEIVYVQKNSNKKFVIELRPVFTADSDSD